MPNKCTLVQPIINVLYKGVSCSRQTFTLYINLGAKHEQYTVEGNSWLGVGKLNFVLYDD